LVIEPESGRRSGSAVQRIAQAFRALPIAVIGRIEGNAFVLDLRCLGDVEGFMAQLPLLRGSVRAQA